MSPKPTAMKRPSKVKVFVDADVIFAGSASPSEHSASNVILRMAEITLIDAVTSQQAITEAERNLALKLPGALPVFGLLVSRSLQITPSPTVEEAKLFSDLAGPKDVSILAAAVREKCEWLVTFNTRHFQPGHPSIIALRPGEFGNADILRPSKRNRPWNSFSNGIRLRLTRIIRNITSRLKERRRSSLIPIRFQFTMPIIAIVKNAGRQSG